jgi:adenylate kinase family enzyme
VVVAGVSGSGKTTLAAAIAQVIGARHTEIDALFHGPGWTPRPEFLADVRTLVETESWTTEWQYGSARPILAGHADLLVWLDLPFVRVTLPRLLRRTLIRRWRREVLWNGNVEPPLRTIFTDPTHVIRWGIQTRSKFTGLVPLLEPEYPELVIVRLRSPAEVDRWIAGPLSRSVL